MFGRCVALFDPAFQLAFPQRVHELNPGHGALGGVGALLHERAQGLTTLRATWRCASYARFSVGCRSLFGPLVFLSWQPHP